MDDSRAGHRLSSHLKMLWEFWRLEEVLGTEWQATLSEVQGERVRCWTWRGSQAVKRKLGVELREAASDLPAMSHTNHETTWNTSPTHTSPLSLTSSLFFVVILLFCFLSSYTLHCFPASLSPVPILVSFCSEHFADLSHFGNTTSSTSELTQNIWSIWWHSTKLFFKIITWENK